jgi:CDP-glucose 4,6-dehydratase
VIKATLAGEPFRIRSDGLFVRDFLYIKDAADSYLFLAQSVARGSPAGTYNFSLEVQLTVMDCANQVLELMNRTDLKPVISNQASGEIRKQYMNCDKARAKLGWEPEHSMRDGLIETIDWYRSFFEDLREHRARGVAIGM